MYLLPCAGYPGSGDPKSCRRADDVRHLLPQAIVGVKLAEC